jgi:hypothetical protein
LSEKRLKRLGDGGKGCAYVYVVCLPLSTHAPNVEFLITRSRHFKAI